MRFCCWILLTVIAPTAFAQGATDHLRSAKSISDKLRVAAKPDDIGSDARVPEPVPALVAQLKQEVREWVAGQMATAPAVVNPARLAAQLNSDVRQAGLIAMDSDHDSNPFGAIFEIRVLAVPNTIDLLQIIVSYDSFCPSDDSVLVFERKEGRWQLALNFDNTDLTHPWGERGILYSGVSPRDSNGQYYVLVVRTRSYCPLSGSVWNGVNYHVLRPGRNPASPLLLLSEEHGYHEQQDFRVELKATDFTLDFPGGSESATPIRIFRYSVLAQRVQRIDPVAANPGVFVGEWLTVPWAEAARWSNPDGLDGLRNWHEKLKDKISFMIQRPFVQYCSQDRKLMEVSFSDDPEGPGENDPLFVVREIRPGVWRVMNVTTKSLAGCSDLQPLPEETRFRRLPESLNRAR